jgi:hypothetical protein
MLPFSVVEPVESPSYVPAEPDEVVDGILERMVRADRDLHTLFLDADTALGAVDDQVTAQLTEERPDHAVRRQVGQAFSFVDPDGDALEVTYFEQDCENHGREGGFHFAINDEEEVVIPADLILPLVQYLFQMKKYSERPGE